MLFRYILVFLRIVLALIEWLLRGADIGENSPFALLLGVTSNAFNRNDRTFGFLLLVAKLVNFSFDIALVGQIKFLNRFKILDVF